MTENYATPHLELDGEPIEDLKQFEEPITRGIVPTRLSGHDAQTDNIFRAYQGYAAIRAHAPLMHGGPGGFDCGCDLSDRIKDLLSDLHHLCDTAGVDWMLAVGSSAA